MKPYIENTQAFVPRIAFSNLEDLLQIIEYIRLVFPESRGFRKGNDVFYGNPVSPNLNLKISQWRFWYITREDVPYAEEAIKILWEDASNT